MGFETVYQFREFEFDLDTSGPLTFEVFTELPGSSVVSRYAATLNTETTTTGRTTRRLRVPGRVKGKLHKVKLSGAANCKLFGARVYARALGDSAAWGWYSLPVPPTEIDWSRLTLPIVPTPDAWAMVRIPLNSTPAEATWVSLPVDQIA